MVETSTLTVVSLEQEKYPDLDVKSHKAEIDALTTEVFTGGGEAEEEVSLRFLLEALDFT